MDSFWLKSLKRNIVMKYMGFSSNRSLVKPKDYSIDLLQDPISMAMRKLSCRVMSFLNEIVENVYPINSLLSDSLEMLKIMSFNILCEDKSSNEHDWHLRKKYIASIVRFHKLDVIGFQEPFMSQVLDLKQLLFEFDWCGVGADDGKNKGFINAIFYKKSRFDLLESSSFFLSDTPDKPSKGWDSSFNRTVTWAKFYDKKTKKTFFFFNTHFDYYGEEARNNSAMLIRKKISEIANDYPFVVTGDFNLFPTLGGDDTYKLLTSKVKNTKSLIDAQKSTFFPHHGPTGTWSGFKEAGQPGIKPDYIFVGKNVKVINHGVLADTFDGNFPSDHLPVIAEINI